MWDKVIIMFAAYLGFVLFYHFFVEPAATEYDYERKMTDVLNKEEHKVKGRFE